MDPRIREQELFWLKSRGMCPYDLLSFPGSSIWIAKAGWKNQKQWMAWIVKQFIFYWIALSIKFHETEIIIISHHKFCGAYKWWHGELEGEKEEEQQKADMRTAMLRIKQNFPQIRKLILVWGELEDEEGKEIVFKEIEMPE
ncbi:hypothetical protein COT99_03755 [Candidatus Falkowbacteria bacterium CG10_big_fil_rev_8_21_14_0_10_43_10]|uniref:Carbonic anhydrase n=1 Tax=Candidatus Falkowbacteria bacterium CG10_big_fil_rev_8_21_14_0_10_43_10 TaxID=1974567 RepID=A0A2H0V1A9_9BACT|nr:MAG: hypothetical protein COT99_03755 [Candidatus Falkowbacteria bacterium CG10_big_fil_rev_8_21_14_0_10_43_10]